MLTWPPPSLIRGSIARLIIGQILEELLTFLSSFLLGLMLAPPYMRLQRPRPPLHELLRQPGFVACSSIILATLVLVDLYWLARVKVPPGGVILVVLFLLWPLLDSPPGVREPAGSIGCGGPSGGVLVADDAAILTRFY